MLNLKLLSEELPEFIPLEEPSSLFESAILSRGYFPSRTFVYSVVGHLVGFAIVIMLSIFRNIPEPPSMVEHITFIDLRVSDVVFLPPIIAPGNQGTPLPARKSAQGPKKAAEQPASNSKGLTYPGPQTIVSDPPNPTNLIQTVLQPDIEKPPILVPPVPLPNIVQVAEVAMVAPKLPEPVPEPPKEAKPAEAPKPEPVPEPVKEVKPPEEPRPEPVPAPPPEPKVPEPAMVLPALALAPPMRLEKPKIMLPASIPPLIEARPSERREKIELPSLMKAPALPPPPEPAPEAKPAEIPQKPPEPAKAETPSNAGEKPKELPEVDAESATQGKKNLLSLTPIPTATTEPVKVPPGEARGQFAISPEPSLAPSETKPGAKTGIRSDAIGIGNKTEINANETAAPQPPAVAVGKTKAAIGKGAAGGGQGSGAGGNSKPGPGIPGAGSGPISGTGKGSVKKPFAGITIVGGSVEPGNSPDNPPIVPARKPLQTAYGLSVISTENSGGGLPFFGVFSHEQIYTVYLDMRQVEADQDPSWTLEFAVIPGAASQSGGSRSQQGLILPFPIEKERPVFPEDVVRKHSGKMVIVYSVVNVEGKLEQVSVKDSPDASLNEPLLNALIKWVFRPAQLNGEPAAAKLLMGIPLWLPQQ